MENKFKYVVIYYQNGRRQWCFCENIDRATIRFCEEKAKTDERITINNNNSEKYCLVWG